MTKKLIYVLLFFLLNTTFYSQEENNNVYSHPLFGDTLDAFENSKLHIINNIPNIKHAVFYINEEKYLNVKILYNEEALRKDTLLEKAFTITSLQEHLETYIRLKGLEKSIAKSNIEIFFRDDEYLECTLLDVKTSSLVVSTQDNIEKVIKKTDLDFGSIYKVDFDEISYIEHTDKEMGFGNLTLIGFGIGAVGGYLGGDDEGGLLNFTAGDKAIFYGIFGGLIALIADIIGYLGADAEEFYLYNEKDIIELKKHEFPINKKWLENF